MILHDSRLLCEAGDIIDNGVYHYIEAVLLKRPVVGALKEAFKGLCADKNADIPKSLLVMEPRFAKTVKVIAKRQGLKIAPDGSIPWDMSVIGEMTDFLETQLKATGIHTCHPFEDEDGCICYACEDRCVYCTRAK